MKTLILSCNTGEGHNSCARAIQEAFEARGADCEIVDSLLFISRRASEFISSWHTRIYCKLPKLFRIGYAGAEKRTSLFERNTPVYRYLTSGSHRLYEFIENGRYDAVVCTHVFAAVALTDAVGQYGLSVPTAFVATDYTCSPGVGDTGLDWYFIPDASLAEEFAACGVPEEKLIASGMPVRASFYQSELTRTEAKRRCGVREDGRHLLMMCGSIGCGPLCELARLLAARMAADEEVTIVCGHNEKLLEKLRQMELPPDRVHVLGFVADMQLLMRSADLFLTKPGGLSTSEAAALELPMVLIDAVAGCEEHNLDYFLSCGAAVTADGAEALCSAALSILDDGARLETMRAALRKERPALPAQIIYMQLCAAAQRRPQARREDAYA